MSKTEELTIGQTITIGTSTVTIKRIGNRKEGTGPRRPVVVVEVNDGKQGGE